MLVQEKIRQAVSILKEFDVDCWITFVRESQINGDPTLAFLVTADVTWHSAFMITSEGKTCAIVGKYDRKTVEETGGYDEVISFVEGIKQPFQDYLQKINPRKIAVNYSENSEICDGITHGMFLTMHHFLSELGYQDRIISAERIISALRERKSDTELDYMRGAICATQDIFQDVSGFIRPGKSEKEIAAFMKQRVRDLGLSLGWEEMVCPAVFTGPETAQAHYAPSDRIVETGQILNMDFGVRYNNYVSDMQRTFYILQKEETSAPEDVMKGFETIVRAIEESRKAMKPGVAGQAIDKVARDIVVSAGYEEFPHALGHQVGRYSHDGTALLGPAWEKYADKPFRPLEKGMVFTLEPRLTVPDRGVATIEEMVVITDSGAEYLSTPQKDLILIR
jgi:Xaa-Pro aminopeptidase